MNALHNLIEMCWDDKKPKGGDLRAAEKELAAQAEALQAAREALLTISPDGWMQYLSEEECVTQCGGTPEQGHAADCKYIAALSKIGD